MKKQNLAILGSTGSIGTQTLDVVAANPDLFAVYAITANNNVDLLIKQARTFHPEAVVVANEAHYNTLREALTDLPIKVFAGSDAVAQVAALPSVDTVVTAMVGYAGLKPTIEAVKAGKRIALANKETLVVAGELVTRLVQQHHAAILPVDSEHGAIFQCLVGENADEVEKIILTASGGPFRNKSCEELASVTAKDALRHPTWQMGAKITIDSASLMNKGFEVIEAKWLFGLRPEQIDVVIHPQSIIHSMVQYRDGSIKAQLGVPDMRLPIEYALTFPQRRQTNFERLDFTKCSQLTFEQPDPTRFRNLALAFEAMRRGGNMPCALNAANEIAVDAFLHERIGFLQMSNLIETVLERTTFIATPSYNDYVACDTETRQLARELIAHYS
ncbi:MAG: 1-deoxy-D-xylulose-5-phosphate reductoisomerase [Paludibacteraceae bacterium]|nr:1-deoxy-D-xylulose-5-phosphate reductoisomerase [Bacteroidales bacterium]MDD6642283.1 1-deoxy-D-xylulose-5-phosphate reductoisomerase [Bacteroidales bacterium]MDD7528109.1 1-deoxy-D-xylulose-5-phosphate reductoisomerase [Bacteroidales bacterium]MDY4512520.1 1-deoxy-D-xylulose-5-phosphate reductoisomerase [Paludibacteraceae bacterium]MDY4850560.1 1-deoxy-D-xylulose-5-phosphate reductoisomerase [Paludibacteraceae bacterium]